MDSGLSNLSDQTVLQEQVDLDELFTDWNLVNQPTRLPDSDGDVNEDSDFSDLVLNYINQMLMEEDIVEKNCMFQESAALQAAEKSFYNALLVKDQDQGQVPNPGQDQDDGQNQDHDNGQLQYRGHVQDQEGSLYNIPIIQDQGQDHDHGQDQDHGQLQNRGQDQDNVAEESLHNLLTVQDQEHGQLQNDGQDQDLAAELIASFGISSSMSGTDLTKSSLLPNTLISFDSQSRFNPSYSLFSGTRNIVDGFLYSPVSILSSRDIFCDNPSMVQFRNGIDEASRFLPNGTILDFKGTGVLDQTTEKKREISFTRDGSRGRKNLYSKDLIEDGRYSKQSAVYNEPPVSSKMFDDVLLCGGPKTHPFQCDFVCKKYANKGQPKGSNGIKARAKKPKEAVDLRILLTLCAQSVSINDQRGATDLLKRIREHASPTGDGMQRLAHYFSAGLEARMAGSGTQIYKALLSIPTSAVDVLKAYHLFLGCFPFTKISHFVSNKTIMSVAQNKTKLHIIDFGILHGFQWPCLIQQFSTRPGGPPELRITGIDFPCPGFRPTQRVEETGRRLANYAETFGVRFKFKAIAQKWETIRIEDLELDDEETLVVNCGYRFRNLLDETVMVDSPRKKVLHLIRKMKPEIFIHGIVNGSYGVPFFLTRFREALFFFSSLFDMLDATVDRLTEERMLIEKTMWGREAMNVIACEDGERIERPETYKQWQVRIQRAGFRQVAFDKEIVNKAKDRGSSDYHKDFVIDEDGYWMLQGWKGRVLYAISSWKPAFDK
ncbi:putative transcription factor GRAS family [Helianthus annuus]|uniref:Transcription factor GRAS family n=1 Tax=Helianthus annuus TaxID=4232 RepID=A0A9K3H4P5_HELAN|nr:scarecrow-like protein 33 [Helianthus annuus]KAF5767170.1 putative transcription factor GRAS family [Helianthus annuus]KAJ0462775.1 putative transcription factor GRAS family [Helianthus annuus]KAJ0466447.1 putative transcription factor GRAS family [Helianthus annuus]KAJ0484110.1 putative transcription factor GRAS family [Helianthus annuus]KAJ0654692.1 putative transcription factor GRAS family [Helianthus annuus]